MLSKFKLSKVVILTLVLISALLASLAPGVVSAKIDRLVPDCDSASAEQKDWCNFTDFIALLDNILKWLVEISVSVAALLIVYGGLIMIMAPTDSERRTKAKHIFTSAIIGLIAILAAWLVIDTILQELTGQGVKARLSGNDVSTLLISNLT